MALERKPLIKVQTFQFKILRGCNLTTIQLQQDKSNMSINKLGHFVDQLMGEAKETIPEISLVEITEISII